MIHISNSNIPTKEPQIVSTEHKSKREHDMLRFKVNQLRSSLRKSNYNVHTKYKTIIQKNQYTTTYYSHLNKKCKQYYYFQNLIKNNNLLSSSSTIRIIANNNRKNFTTKTSNKTNNSDSNTKSKNSENIKTNIVNTKQDVNYGNKDENIQQLRNIFENACRFKPGSNPV